MESIQIIKPLWNASPEVTASNYPTCKSFFPLDEGSGTIVTDAITGQALNYNLDPDEGYSPPLPQVTWGGYWTYAAPSVFVPVSNCVSLTRGPSVDFYVTTTAGTYNIGTKKFLLVASGRIYTGAPIQVGFGWREGTLLSGVRLDVSANGAHLNRACDGTTKVEATIGTHTSGTDYTVWMYGQAGGTLDESELVGTGSTVNNMVQQSLATLTTLGPDTAIYLQGALYGVGLFVFDGAFPSNMVLASQWMGTEWARGHKVLHPGCADWT